MEDGKYYKGLLVLPLKENILENIKGYAKFSEGLNVTEAEIEEFEKNLPFKEKKIQASQKEFEIASIEIDE